MRFKGPFDLTRESHLAFYFDSNRSADPWIRPLLHQIQPGLLKISKKWSWVQLWRKLTLSYFCNNISMDDGIMMIWWSKRNHLEWIWRGLRLWFSTLEPLRLTKDENEHFGGILYSYWTFFLVSFTPLIELKWTYLVASWFICSW